MRQLVFISCIVHLIAAFPVKLSQLADNDDAIIDAYDRFGNAAEGIGDVNADHVPDMAVGAPMDDDGGPNRGAVWIIALRPNAGALWFQKISNIRGGFEGVLRDDDMFGWSIAALGDLNGDSVTDIVVGAPSDRTGQKYSAKPRGAVWILSLRRDGTVSHEQKLAYQHGGFIGEMREGSAFGADVAGPGDINGDGVPDLIVGAPGDSEGGFGHGAIWAFFLKTTGSALFQRKINHVSEGILNEGDFFGYSVAAIGDVNQDGMMDLAVGAPYDDDKGRSRGAVWIFCLATDATVKMKRKISTFFGGGDLQLSGNFTHFGTTVSAFRDVDGNGVPDILVGAPTDSEDGWHIGSIYLLLLKRDGTLLHQVRLSAGTFMATQAGSQFATSISVIGSLSGGNDIAIAVGVPLWDDTDAPSSGTVVVSAMSSAGTATTPRVLHSRTSLSQAPANRFMGQSAVGIGDIDLDGVTDVAIGDYSYGSHRGRVQINFLRADGTTRRRRSLESNLGGMPALPASAQFGFSLAAPGDLNGDGIPDLLVGSPVEDSSRGALRMLLLASDGSVITHRVYSYLTKNFPSIGTGSRCMTDIAYLGRGKNDSSTTHRIAFSCVSFPDDKGSVFIARIRVSNGVLQGTTQIPSATAGFQNVLRQGNHLGTKLAMAGDINGDGNIDLFATVLEATDVQRRDGAVWLLFLSATDTVIGQRRIAATDLSSVAQTRGEGSLRHLSVAYLGQLDPSRADMHHVLFAIRDVPTMSDSSGALGLVELHLNGTIEAYQQMDARHPLLRHVIRGADWRFGSSIDVVGDIDGDGTDEVIVGSMFDSEVASRHGSVWILSLLHLLSLSHPETPIGLAHVQVCNLREVKQPRLTFHQLGEDETEP